MPSRYLNLCLPHDLSDALEVYAAREDRSLSSAVRTIVRNHLITTGLCQPEAATALPVVLTSEAR